MQNISLDIVSGSSTLNHLKKILIRYKKNPNDFPDVTKQDLHELNDIKLKLTNLQQKWHTLFIWQDGPLVEAMKEGHLFLLDEISLADDSVLERLNSVLEPERTLVRFFLQPNYFLSFSPFIFLQFSFKKCGNFPKH